MDLDDSHDTLLSSIREMVGQEVVGPLRQELAAVSTKTDKIQEEQVTMKHQMASMDDRILACEKGLSGFVVGGFVPRTVSGQSHASTV